MLQLDHARIAFSDPKLRHAAPARPAIAWRENIDAIDGCAILCLRTGLMSRRGTHMRADHHFECATIKGIPKATSNALRYNVLSSLLFPHCSLTDALLPLLYCTAPHLAAFVRSTTGDRRHPGRRHSQQGS